MPTSPMSLLYKIAPAAAWREAEAVGVFAGSPDDRRDGFIHLSTAAQLAGTAAKHFAGRDDLLLVSVDPMSLQDPLRWEPSRGGDLFPHLYGALQVSAAVAVAELPLGPDGRHVLPVDLAALLLTGPRADLLADGWIARTSDNFIGLVGPLWARADGDSSRYGFLAERRHLNRGGIVHGGMIMTFIDQALGMAAWAANGMRPQVTVQLDTHFVSGVKEDEFAVAACRIVRETRSIVFLAAEVTVGDRIVATASGVWKLRDAAAARAPAGDPNGERSSPG